MPLFPRGSVRPFFDQLERCFTILALVLYSGGPITVLLTGGRSQGDGAAQGSQDFPLMRLIFIATYGIFLLLLALRGRQTLRVLGRDRLTLILPAFAFASQFWSATPDETFSKGVALIGTTLFGIYLATRYNLKQQIEVVAWAYGIVISLSIFYALALPQFGIMGGVHSGDWRGIYTHKNTLGKQMVLSGATFLVLLLNPQRRSLWPGLGLLASVMLIALCTSKGAMINFVVVVSTLMVCRVLRWPLRWMMPLLWGALFVGVGSLLWGVNNLEAIATFLNKDLTLTGRTNIWALVWEMIQQKPWLGYGYFGFWNGLDSDAAYVWRAFLWETPNAHNGFLDLWIQLGFVGVALFLTGIYLHLMRSLLQLRCTTEPETLWPVLLMVYMLFSNLPESSFLLPHDVFWVLYVSTTLQSVQLSRFSRASPSAQSIAYSG